MHLSFLDATSAPSAPSIVAVVVVELAADDVIAQILHLLPVRVKSLHSSRETSTAGQVEVLQRGAVLEQTCERLESDGCVAKIQFPAMKNGIRYVTFSNGKFELSRQK